MADLILFNLEGLLKQPKGWDLGKLDAINQKLLNSQGALSKFQQACLDAFNHFNASNVNVPPKQRKMPYLATQEAIELLAQLQSSGLGIGVYSHEIRVDKLVKQAGLSGYVPPDRMYSNPIFYGNLPLGFTGAEFAFAEIGSQIEERNHELHGVVDSSLGRIIAATKAFDKYPGVKLYLHNPGNNSADALGSYKGRITPIKSLSQIVGFVGAPKQ